MFNLIVSIRAGPGLTAEAQQLLCQETPVAPATRGESPSGAAVAVRITELKCSGEGALWVSFSNAHADCPAPQCAARAPCHTTCPYREEFASVLFDTSLPKAAGGDRSVPGRRPPPVPHGPFELRTRFQVRHQHQAEGVRTALILLTVLLAQPRFPHADVLHGSERS